MSRIVYRTLFSVSVWHDYELARGEAEFAALDEESKRRILSDYSIHDTVRVQPAEDTRRLLRNHGLRVVPLAEGFAVVGAVRESEAAAGKFVLEVPLPAEFDLRFNVELLRPGLLHEANLPAGAPREGMLLFSNRSASVTADGELHLTHPVPAFDPERDYIAGDLVVDRAEDPTVLLEAVADAPPSAAPVAEKWLDLPAPRFDAARVYQVADRVLHAAVVFAAQRQGVLPSPPSPEHWLELYDAHLQTGVTALDRVTVLSRDARLAIPELVSSVRLSVRDRQQRLVLEETQQRRDGELLREIRLNLPSANVGLYSLVVEGPDGTPLPGLPESFYLLDGLLPFALIEIGSSTGEFALTDADGHVTSREYHVRLRHRRAFWRYIFHGDLSRLPPIDLGDLVQESAADAGIYATRRPLPLNAGLIALKPFAGKTLPNPAPASARKDAGKVYAETFIAS